MGGTWICFWKQNRHPVLDGYRFIRTSKIGLYLFNVFSNSFISLMCLSAHLIGSLLNLKESYLVCPFWFKQDPPVQKQPKAFTPIHSTQFCFPCTFWVFLRYQCLESTPGQRRKQNRICEQKLSLVIGKGVGRSECPVPLTKTRQLHVSRTRKQMKTVTCFLKAQCGRNWEDEWFSSNKAGSWTHQSWVW